MALTEDSRATVTNPTTKFFKSTWEGVNRDQSGPQKMDQTTHIHSADVAR
jgi:hypothetical protein